MYDVDILNYTSVWWNGRKKVEEMKRKRGGFFPPLSLLPSPQCFFLLTFLCTSFSINLNTSTGYSLELEDSSDLREQSWDHCTVSHILSLTDQIILRLIIDVKSWSNYWYARTTSSFLTSSCNSGALVRSSVCKLLLLDSLGQFFIYSLLWWETPLKRSPGWFAFAART